MGRRKKAADSNTGQEGVYVFDPDQLNSFMDRLDEKQGAQKKAGMAVANEYRMAEKAGLNRWALNVIRQLEGMERGTMLTALAHLDQYRKERLANRESDLFKEDAHKDAMTKPADDGPDDDDDESEAESGDDAADPAEGETPPAPVEAASSGADGYDPEDFTMKAGAAQRAAGKGKADCPHPVGSTKRTKWLIGWCFKDDELTARGGPQLTPRDAQPAAIH